MQTTKGEDGGSFSVVAVSSLRKKKQNSLTVPSLRVSRVVCIQELRTFLLLQCQSQFLGNISKARKNDSFYLGKPRIFFSFHYINLSINDIN